MSGAMRRGALLQRGFASVPSLKPAAAAASGGLLSGIFGGGAGDAAASMPPLTQPVGPTAAAMVAPEKAPTTQTTKLACGVTVATENVPGPTMTIGAYLSAGSVHAHKPGVCHLLEKASWLSTADASSFAVRRSVEAVGGTALAAASREVMGYTFDTARTQLAEATELLVESTLYPAFNDWEVAEAKKAIEKEMAEYADNAHTAISEGMHIAGYQGALGQPLLCTQSSLAALQATDLVDFVAQNYHANRLVIAGSGMEHEELVKLVEPMLEGLTAGSAAAAEVESTYIGGDWKQAQVEADTCHVALAFEGVGGWRDTKSCVALTVLTTMLGGGASFSAGGPGKGMYSRLYTGVLNHHAWVHNCTAFAQTYNNTGLVGASISCDPNGGAQAVDLLCSQLQEVAAGKFSAEELERAKAATAASVLYNLEQRTVVTEDIGKQVLTYGHRKPIAEFLDEVNNLTAKDISNALSKAFKTPLTMASTGAIMQVPTYASVASRF